MRIVEQSFEILTPVSEGGIEELRLIEKAGRTCYKSEDRMSDDGRSAVKLIKNTFLEHHHETPIEFSFMAVKVITDRGVSHEIVRHRLFSYAQESTRYVNYAKGKFGSEISVIRPCDLEEGSEAERIWVEAMEEAERHYLSMIGQGCPPQLARAVLPTCTKTEINIAGNYREWRHFFKLRTSAAAHPQIRKLACEMLAEFRRQIPVVFDDLN